MEFIDHSPPSSPTLDQQQDALRKGLGRARQWVDSGKLDEQLLLQACLHDLRFDGQCEASRGDWLWRLVEKTGAVNRFRSPLFQALSELNEDSAASQLCELARHYAEAGDDAFRSALYDIVKKKPVDDCPWMGEEEIIRLDGEQAFLFAARIRGERAANVEWDWHDLSLIQDAVDRFGDERVRCLLNALEDQGTRQFLNSWSLYTAEKAASPQTESHRERMQRLKFDDVLKAAQSDDRCIWLRGWGMRAGDAELNQVLSHLWSGDDSDVNVKLLQVFSHRPLPRFDERLIALCHSSNPKMRASAFKALACNTHSLVRAFAKTTLEDGLCDGSAVRLFVKNYEAGDEQRIFESLMLPTDECELHWLLMDVTKVLESNPQAECLPLASAVYGLTPCDNCRFYAARLLHGRQVAPEWLVRECRYDSNEDCRALFEQAGNSIDPKAA